MIAEVVDFGSGLSEVAKTWVEFMCLDYWHYRSSFLDIPHRRESLGESFSPLSLRLTYGRVSSVLVTRF